MYINSISSNDVSMKGNQNPKSWKSIVKNVKQKFIDVLPEATFKNGNNEIKNKINDRVSRPCENRLIMGTAALATQPAIDYYNHRVDDETRVVSRNRTIAKIIAGTTVGAFVVRGPVYKLVEKTTNPCGTTKFSKALIPKAKNIIEDLSKNQAHLKNYRSALAMIFALIAMSVTNFVLDAPLTLLLTDRFNKKSMKKEVKNG